MNETTAEQVLDAPMGENDANAATIRAYLMELLASLWERRGGFDGKRPFGSSDWEWPVYDALLSAGLVDGQRNSDGAILTVDEAVADRLITDVIRALGSPGARISA